MEYINFNGCGQIRTKSDLMKYALENTFKRDSHGGFASYDYEAAEKLFVFYLQHVSLPDSEPTTAESVMSQLSQIMGAPKVNGVCK